MEILVESAQSIRQFFREQGYTQDSLSRLGLAELHCHSLARRSASAWAVTGNARLDLLVRLFYLGETVAMSQGERLIPQEILSRLLTSGLLGA